MEDSPRLPRWIRLFIDIGAGFFILALVISAVFDPKIRVLHTLQALIYVAVLVLTRKGSSWGFGAGTLISVLWNYTSLFVNTFIAAGWEQLLGLLRTGRLERPDLFIALVAAGGHFLLIAGCLAGFLRRRPGALEWGKFLAGGALAIAYFVLIIYTTGPQYIPQIRKVFHL
jgi:hypothetical protein